MCECLGGGEECLCGFRLVGGGSGVMVGAGAARGDGYAGCGLGEVVDGVSDEGVAVFVEGADEGSDLGGVN